MNQAKNITLFAAFLGWMFDGIEMGLFPLVARPALQEFQHTAGIVDERFVQLWMGRITATFLLGAAAGGLGFGWLGDRIGRRRALALSVVTYSLFTGLNYFAHAPWELAVYRFIAALGMGGEWSLGVALVMEVWPHEKRPLVAGLIGVASNAGYALIALVGVFFVISIDSWRWVMLVGMLPAVLAILIICYVPESQQWENSVAAGAGNNPLREIIGPKLFKTTVLGVLLASVALIVTWGIVQWIPLWADEMTGGKQPHVKAYALLSIATGAIIGSMAAPLLGTRIRRRQVYFMCCLGSLLVASVLFRCFNHFSGVFLVMVMLVGAFSSSFYGWLPQYLPELFPTRVRATGQGIAYNFGRIFAAVGAWYMGSIMALFGNSYSRAGAAIVFIYVVGMICIWMAPETKDRPLPA